MEKPDELYVKEFKEWLNEQKEKAEFLNLCIESAEKLKQSNVKQLGLHKERINIYIEQFNQWAKEKGAEPLNMI